ncbi:MAG: hypothetical protein HRF40_00115 [Nitrososphaera sp.]
MTASSEPTQGEELWQTSSTGRQHCKWDRLPENLKTRIKREDGFEIKIGDYFYEYHRFSGNVYRWKKDVPAAQSNIERGVCHFCGKNEPFAYVCTYCNQNFCLKHRLAEMHDCIKTRYVKYIRKDWLRKYGQNITTGMYYVVCDQCGYESDYGLIEVAGAMLVEHIKAKGCDESKIFLQGGG